MHETFWTLLRDPAHWAFEIFLMLLFDGLIGAVAWPFVRKHWKHHVRRDKIDEGRDVITLSGFADPSRNGRWMKV